MAMAMAIAYRQEAVLGMPSLGVLVSGPSYLANLMQQNIFVTFATFFLRCISIAMPPSCGALVEGLRHYNAGDFH